MRSTRQLQTLDGRALLTLDQAARFLSVNPSTLQRLTEQGKIRSKLVGKASRRWLVSDLVAYIDSLG